MPMYHDFVSDCMAVHTAHEMGAYWPPENSRFINDNNSFITKVKL